MRSLHILFFCIFLCFPLHAQELPRSPEKMPFFILGDGKLNFKNPRNGRSLNVTYIHPDGTLNETALTQIDSFFGFPKEMGEHISPRMLGMLDYFTDTIAPQKTINLHSGYRSPSYNNNLRKKGRTAAKTSTHMDGMAIDFSIDGFDGKKMWEFIRAPMCCGVGNYGGGVVHIDAGRPRFWEKATAKVNTNESDFNRMMYVSTEYDRYHSGERVRFHFTSVSDFGFGVKAKQEIISGQEKQKIISEIQISGKYPAQNGCIPIPDRTSARFLYFTLPSDIKSGNYKLKVEFCNRITDEMPQEKMTNSFEIRQ